MCSIPSKFRMTELTEIWKLSNYHNDLPSRKGALSPNGVMDLSHLKQDLNDPEFRKRLDKLKNRQQEYMTSILRKKGQIINLDGGGSIVISSPNMTAFTIPTILKRKPVELWSEAERIWLNM